MPELLKGNNRKKNLILVLYFTQEIMQIPKYSKDLTKIWFSKTMFGKPIGKVISVKGNKKAGTLKAEIEIFNDLCTYKKGKIKYKDNHKKIFRSKKSQNVIKNSFYFFTNNSMAKQIIIEKEIGKLPKKKQDKIMYEYDRRKLNMGSARALWFFGFHYLHTNKVGLWFLYLLSCFLYVGIIRRIVQAFMLKDEINKKNKEILEMIYRENA